MVAVLTACASVDDGVAGGDSALGEGARPHDRALGKGALFVYNSKAHAMSEPNHLTLGSGGGRAYVANSEGTIHRLTPSLRQLVEGVAPQAVVASEHGITWLDSKEGAMMRAKDDGSSPRELDNWYWTAPDPRQLIRDGAQLYWRSQSYFSKTNALWMTPIAGGKAKRVDISCTDVIADGHAYCFRGKSKITKTSLATRAESVASPEYEGRLIAALSVTSDGLFYAVATPKSANAPEAVEFWSVSPGAEATRLARGEGASWADGVGDLAVSASKLFASRGSEVVSINRSGGPVEVVTKLEGEPTSSTHSIVAHQLIVEGSQLFVRAASVPSAPGAGTITREFVVSIALDSPGGNSDESGKKPSPPPPSEGGTPPSSDGSTPGNPPPSPPPGETTGPDAGASDASSPGETVPAPPGDVPAGDDSAMPYPSDGEDRPGAPGGDRSPMSEGESDDSSTPPRAPSASAKKAAASGCSAAHGSSPGAGGALVLALSALLVHGRRRSRRSA